MNVDHCLNRELRGGSRARASPQTHLSSCPFLNILEKTSVPLTISDSHRSCNSTIPLNTHRTVLPSGPEYACSSSAPSDSAAILAAPMSAALISRILSSHKESSGTRSSTYASKSIHAEYHASIACPFTNARGGRHRTLAHHHPGRAPIPTQTTKAPHSSRNTSVEARATNCSTIEGPSTAPSSS